MWIFNTFLGLRNRRLASAATSCHTLRFILCFHGFLHTGRIHADEVEPWKLVRPEPSANETVKSFGIKILTANANDAVRRLQKYNSNVRGSVQLAQQIKNQQIGTALRPTMGPVNEFTFKFDAKRASIITEAKTPYGSVRDMLDLSKGNNILGYYFRSFGIETRIGVDEFTTFYRRSW